MESNNKKTKIKELQKKGVSKIIIHYKSDGGQVKYSIGNYQIYDEELIVTNDRSLKTWAIDWNSIISIEVCNEKDFKAIPKATPEQEKPMISLGKISDKGFEKHEVQHD